MGGFFNGRFEKQRSLVSRQFDKVVLARVLFVIIAAQMLLLWMVLNALAGAETGRTLGLVTDFANTMNNAITTVVGFIGGIMTGKALEAASRASDKPQPPVEGAKNGSNA